MPLDIEECPACDCDFMGYTAIEKQQHILLHFPPALVAQGTRAVDTIALQSDSDSVVSVASSRGDLSGHKHHCAKPTAQARGRQRGRGLGRGRRGFAGAARATDGDYAALLLWEHMQGSRPIGRGRYVAVEDIRDGS